MSRVVEYIRKDFFIIVVCLIAILACLLIYSPAAKVIHECNINCEQQFYEKCKTDAVFQPFIMNDSVTISDVFLGGKDEN